MDKNFIFTMYWDRNTMSEPEGKAYLEPILTFARNSGWNNAELQIVIDGYARNLAAEQIVNRFLADATRDHSFIYGLFYSYNLKDPACWIDFCKTFIVNYLKEVSKPVTMSLKAVSSDEEPIDVFPRTAPNYYIRVYAPKSSLPDGKYDDFFNLGPDDLLVMPCQWIFEYVLIPFYQKLLSSDQWDNPEFNDLSKYQIGLA